MILSFDKFERYELPQVTLCNPNSRAIEVDGKITITDTVGVLSNTKGMNLKLNFNAPHELSFDYYRHKSSDPIKQSFYDSIYEAIQTDRYIYLTDIGYFIISSVTDSDEDNIDRKSISLKSCEENEFATAEGLHLKEGTYYLCTEDNQGLLDLFLLKTAGWTIGYIDPSLLTKPYYVEDTEVDNGYNFLYTTIQDMFECIVEPDIIKRTISVYSRVYYAEHHLTDIHIAKYNLLKHKTVEENDEDKYTALNVQGKDENLEIRTVNPTGKNIIYNFDSRHCMMSPDLQVAVVKWQEKCESVEDEYLTLQQGYYNDMQNIVFPLEQDVKVLELQLKQQQQTRDLIVIGEQDKVISVVESLPEKGKSDVLYFIPTTTTSNYEEYVWENDSWKYIDLIQVDDISDTNQQRALDLVNAVINNTNAALVEKQSMLEDEKNKIQTNYSERIDQINSECAFETTDIFTTELRNELMTHIKPTDYVDEYMLVTESMTYPQRFEKAKELMDRAQLQLVKISSGQKTYSIDTRSFLFNKQFRHFSEQLCAGAIIYVETKNDIMEQLHLTGIGINFDEKTADFTLGNKYDRSDLKALYDEALGKNSKSFTELKYIAGIIEDQQKQLDYQKNWVADLRTLTLNNVLTSEDQAIEINNRGLIGRKRRLDENGEWAFDENGNPYFEDEQVKLIHNSLIFTKDNWKHAEAAVGKIAVGYNPDGSVKYDYGMNGRVLIGELILGNNLVLTGTGAGIKIKNSSGEDVFYADDDGNLILSSTIFANSGQIGGWDITGAGLSNCYGKTTNGFEDNLVGVWRYGVHRNNENEPYLAITAGGHSGIIGVAPFRVYYDGSFVSTKGQIGGWTIDTNSLKNGILGTSGSAFVCTGTTSNVTLGGHTGTGWVFGAGTNFGVTNNGELYATKLYATGGKIGNITIGTNLITTKSAPGKCGVTLYGGLEDDGAWVFQIGDGTGEGTPFYVTNKGYLVAQDASVKGKITATSGTFDNCTINETCTVKKVEAKVGYVGDWSISGSVLTSTGFENDSTTVRSTIQIAPSALYVTRGGTTYVGLWHKIASNNASDARLKENIKDLGSSYDTFFDLLQPKQYLLKTDCNGKYHTGFVAQEVLEALDISGLDYQYVDAINLMNKGTESEYWTLDKQEFVALNTWQIQRCKKKIAELENTVAELKIKIQTLTAS